MMRYLVLLAALRLAVLSASAWPTVYPTGTTLYHPDKAFNGYTLFTPLGDAPDGQTYTLYLINMTGAVVHRWSVPFSPLQGRLLPNGNVIVIGRNDKVEPGRPGVGGYEMGGVAGWLVELSWDGKRLFKHVDLKMHHDFARLPNGSTIYLTWEPVPDALREKVRGGIKGSEHSDGAMFNDGLVEIDAQGKTVWEWHANAHLDPELDIIGPLYKRQEWLHANSVAVLADSNIALTGRNTDTLLVIEKRTGKILWRWGNTTYLDEQTSRLEYRSGSDTLGGPHDVREIPSGQPGAGHLVCYDNGTYAAVSRVVEIDPAARKLVWQSSPRGLGRKHFSNFVGGAQRLPNGNTLVCDGANGRFFQVTAKNETVWEYVNPYVTSPLYQGAVFKIHHYAPGYCPQFDKLPAAKGAGVVPKGDNAQGRVGAAL